MLSSAAFRAHRDPPKQASVGQSTLAFVLHILISFSFQKDLRGLYSVLYWLYCVGIETIIYYFATPHVLGALPQFSTVKHSTLLFLEENWRWVSSSWSLGLILFFSEENEMKIFIIADSLLKVENIAHLEDPPLNLCRQIFIEQRI